MVTKAEIEAGYRAKVRLGSPIPPEEIDAILEAAEAARGKGGWWVTPEWHEVGVDHFHLYVFGRKLSLGLVKPLKGGWMGYDGGTALRAEPFPALEDAQDALLASVRPKEEGV